MSCCNHQFYDTTFDTKQAKAELEEYLTTGVKKSSRPFLEVLEPLPLEGATLLDIGGGTGAVAFELMGRGVAHVTHVDISKPYVDTFRSEVKRRSLADQTKSLHGSFPDLHEQAEAADLVTLDKSICCFEDYELLVSTSVAKARKWYVYSIPRSVWWVRLKLGFEMLQNKLNGKHLRLHYHPVKKLEHIITSAGFRRKEVKLHGEWRVAVFEKEG